MEQLEINRRMVRNVVCTSKYNIFTFIPLNLLN
jgi:phospholipid-transporting ATPase